MSWCNNHGDTCERYCRWADRALEAGPTCPEIACQYAPVALFNAGAATQHKSKRIGHSHLHVTTTHASEAMQVAEAFGDEQLSTHGLACLPVRGTPSPRTRTPALLQRTRCELHLLSLRTHLLHVVLSS